MQHMSLAEYKEYKPKKRSKYGAKKTVVDGITFDSKMEARYYVQLKWLKQAKQIKSFTLQPRYILQEAFTTEQGEKVRKIEYKADFEVYKLDGSIEVIDIKGAITKEFAIKKKLFMKRYSHPLILLTYDRTHGWIELGKRNKLKRQRKKVRK